MNESNVGWFGEYVVLWDFLGNLEIATTYIDQTEHLIIVSSTLFLDVQKSLIHLKMIPCMSLSLK